MAFVYALCKCGLVFTRCICVCSLNGVILKDVDLMSVGGDGAAEGGWTSGLLAGAIPTTDGPKAAGAG